jgi:hypothetical protein
VDHEGVHGEHDQPRPDGHAHAKERDTDGEQEDGRYREASYKEEAHRGGILLRGLVQPTGADRSLNSFKMRKGRRIDAERQFELAKRTFYSNGFILLVDDRQVDELEDEIEIRPDTTVTFLKLVPLVGG